MSPCPVSEPAAAYDRVKEGIKNHLPTGELHILTQKYFDNRKEAILSEYPHLVDDYDTEIDYSKRFELDVRTSYLTEISISHCYPPTQLAIISLYLPQGLSQIHSTNFCGNLVAKSHPAFRLSPST